MYLVVLIDVVTIAAGIAVILAIADNCADHAAQHAADGCARTSSDSGDDGPGKRTRPGADHGTGGAAGDHMISVRVARATSDSETAHGDGGEEQAFHVMASKDKSVPDPGTRGQHAAPPFAMASGE
jgi:hypothetical protein